DDTKPCFPCALRSEEDRDSEASSCTCPRSSMPQWWSLSHQNPPSCRTSSFRICPISLWYFIIVEGLVTLSSAHYDMP
ncbi:hypothetical protein PENTCL1PPCAC_6378, partial [Pristionchus entomophagus]